MTEALLTGLQNFTKLPEGEHSPLAGQVQVAETVEYADELPGQARLSSHETRWVGNPYPNPLQG